MRFKIGSEKKQIKSKSWERLRIVRKIDGNNWFENGKANNYNIILTN